MSVTVSTSLDGQTPAAAVPDLAIAIQAARAYAAQAESYMIEAQETQLQVTAQLQIASALVNQAQGLLQLAIQKQAGFSQAGLAAVLQSLPTSLPTSSGALWLDNGVLALS